MKTTIQDDIRGAKDEIEQCYRQIKQIRAAADCQCKPLYLEIERWKIALKDYQKIARDEHV